MSDWLVGQLRNSYRSGPPRSLCTQTACFFLSDNRCGLDPWAASQASQLRTLSPKSSGEAVPSTMAGAAEPQLETPRGNRSPREPACVLACLLRIFVDASCDRYDTSSIDHSSRPFLGLA
ncbi:uncharacterized protein BO87DRAFT_424327 [Aspergillus neoniger CBS 115656]|uniref:Uncharacterized protein n=1 Tax=Aspergillus neoniger (strain CBS 115656) TaxID=1448310 RepID=A0A318YQ75_ASPNB|nr:hypothetical protein BO87DRAFT_424327 [Aspergillus neoniger CBS 115656]PYH36037.1 hypothetical protein BO87DRAFT_424327 [Aspergillus neoniger CBS 115656]